MYFCQRYLLILPSRWCNTVTLQICIYANTSTSYKNSAEKSKTTTGITIITPVMCSMRRKIRISHRIRKKKCNKRHAQQDYNKETDKKPHIRSSFGVSTANAQSCYLRLVMMARIDDNDLQLVEFCDVEIGLLVGKAERQPTPLHILISSPLAVCTNKHTKFWK